MNCREENEQLIDNAEQMTLNQHDYWNKMEMVAWLLLLLLNICWIICLIYVK